MRLTKFMAALCLPLLLALTAQAQSLSAIFLYKVSTALYPSARCNDGSAPAFALRTYPHSTSWVVALQGGGNCATLADCQVRDPSLMSSAWATSPLQFSKAFAGILSADPAVNPSFATANQVFVHYCSSDLWSGGATPSGPSQPYWFQGRAIIKAVVQTLLGMQNSFHYATDVVFTGSSAGGFGVIATANDFLPLLPATMRARIATDAGYVNNFPGFDKTAWPTYTAHTSPTPDEATFAVARPFWNARGDRLCEAAYPGAFPCSDTANIIAAGYIPGPVFVSEFQADAIQLHGEGVPGGVSAPVAAYVAEFANGMAGLLRHSGTTTSVFSPRYLGHEQITSDAAYTKMWAVAGQKMSLSQAFDAWYRQTTLPAKLIQ